VLHSNRGPVALCTLGLGLLNPASFRGQYIKYWPVWLGLRWGVFACVGWQVTLCDPIWQVTPCSGEMGVPLHPFIWFAPCFIVLWTYQ